MKQRNTWHAFIAIFILWAMLPGLLQADDSSIEARRQTLMAAAASQLGKGDPDFHIQRQLEPLVQELLAVAQPGSVESRLPLLAGAWRQLWGPYDYRGDDRGVDPRLDPAGIYQLIYPGGYYYNVGPIRDAAGRPTDRISLLRGEYRIEPERPDALKVRFTSYRGARGLLPGQNMLQLPPLHESGRLPNQITIVPTIIVRLFFGSGYLREVYTDDTLRITYGSGVGGREEEYLYVMERVPVGAAGAARGDRR